MRSRIKYLLLCLLLALGCTPLSAQRFEEIRALNPWNEGINRAGLRNDHYSFSYAEVWGGMQQGGLTDHSRSKESYTAGLHTESIRHFEKISYMGRFAFDYFDGAAMSGSMCLRPGYWPVDIYEYTPGRKVRENYAFEGGLSAELGGAWRGGLWVDFAANNYAKRKDLRHKNTALDLAAAPSIQWHCGAWSLGAAYRYEKHSEYIEAEEIGSTPDSYNAFFDKGLYYGVEALWTSNEIHLDESGVSAFPIKKQLHGGAVQLQYGKRISAPGEFFLEAEYRHTKGDTGEKGVTWHQFSGDDLTGRMRWQRISHGGALHRIAGEISWEQLFNREVILSTETSGGVTISTTYGSVPIYEVRQLRSHLSYTWQRVASRIEVGAEYLLQRKQSSLLYPLLRQQALQQWQIRAEGRWAVGKVEMTLGAWTSWGDLSTQEVAESDLLPESPYPTQQLTYLNWQNEYLTATRLGARLGVRVSIYKGLYADLTGRYEHGFRLRQIPQPNRIEVLLSIGYRW